MHCRKLIAFNWSLFDDKLRPVDGDPVGIQFKDPRQQPIKVPPYRMSGPKLAALKGIIKGFIEDGIIQPASSPWGFPVILVPKPDGSWRMCVDLRKLNEVIKHDSHQSPRNDDALAWLATKVIRSFLDIRWGYHNLLLTDDARDILTFSTPVGSYSYVRLPFGLATAGAMFQRYMNHVLDPWLWRDVIAVVDDVAIGSNTVEEHLEMITRVINTLGEHGFSAKVKKVKLFAEEAIFLGHLSTRDGLQTTGHLVQALREMPTPVGASEPKKRLRSFLGMASYHRKLIRNFAKVTQPLNRLLEANVKFEWSEGCQQAWDSVIEALVESKGVYPVDYTLPVQVRTDACAEGLGAYLFQTVEVSESRDGKTVTRREEHPIEYWSRSVPKNARHYDARRLELLAVIMALEHFRPYIDGVTVSLDTDHRNLTFLQNIKHSEGQLARWAMRLSEFNYKLKYRPGKHMEVADCLSRNPLPEQLTDEQLAQVFVVNVAE